MLLLDEPLGALDLKLRQEMQLFLKSLQRELGMTFLYVTHDQEEALTMSDHLAVFNEGKIEQVGTPAEIYERPATEFVAGFVGTSNILERNGKRFSVRPERVELNGHGEPATVADVVFVGAFIRFLVDTDARRPPHGRAPEQRTAPVTPARACTSAGARTTRTRSNPPKRSGAGGQMRKRMWALLAVARRRRGVPGRGAAQAAGGTLNMIAWEGYLQPQWVNAVRAADRLHHLTRSTRARRTRW